MWTRIQNVHLLTPQKFDFDKLKSYFYVKMWRPLFLFLLLFLLPLCRSASLLSSCEQYVFKA